MKQKGSVSLRPPAIPTAVAACCLAVMLSAGPVTAAGGGRQAGPGVLPEDLGQGSSASRETSLFTAGERTAPSLSIQLEAPHIDPAEISDNPLQIGVSRDIPSAYASGFNHPAVTWHRRADGSRTAAIEITSTGALGLRAGLLVENLPSAAALQFYAPDLGAAPRRVTGQDVNATVEDPQLGADAANQPVLFWSPTVEDETLVIEISLPAGTDPAGVTIAIPKLSHKFRLGMSSLDLELMALGDSASCNIDVSCAWDETADAVAFMQFVSDGLEFVCTGTLLNDLDESTLRLYFLSANHCISTAAAAATLETWWLYETETCDGALRTPEIRSGGADLLFTSADMDTTLLELEDIPPGGARLSGWNAHAPTGTEAFTGIHHPLGDLKKVNRSSTLGFASCGTVPGTAQSECVLDLGVDDPDASHWWVGVDAGAVEAGSSGSGIFMSDSWQLAGVLTGGSLPACTGDQIAVYGRFDRAFEAGVGTWLGASSALYKTSVAAGNLDADPQTEFAVAFLKDNQVRVSYYDNDADLLRSFLGPAALDADIAAGDFDNDGLDDFALATVDTAGNLAVIVYDRNGNPIGTGNGGATPSVAIAAGQFDADPADEYVVSLIMADGRVAALVHNLDGTRHSTAVGGPGRQPEVDVGNFEGDVTQHEYVVSYTSSTDRLVTGTVRGDGTLVGVGLGGVAPYTAVAAADLFSSANDEYAIALEQSDTTLAVIGFLNDGTRIGKVVGGPTRPPRIAGGVFAQTAPFDGVVVGLVQADSYPAAIFYNGQGSRISKGVVSGQASMYVDLATGDVDGDGFDEAILAYVDIYTKPRVAIFGSNGDLLASF